MSYLRYFTYDTFGGILWVGSMVLGGYIAGSRIPNIGKYLHLIIGAIILLSILPPIISIFRSYRSAKTAMSSAAKYDGD